jgi:hypothetical protein
VTTKLSAFFETSASDIPAIKSATRAPAAQVWRRPAVNPSCGDEGGCGSAAAAEEMGKRRRRRRRFHSRTKNRFVGASMGQV